MDFFPKVFMYIVVDLDFLSVNFSMPLLIVYTDDSALEVRQLLVT